MKFFTSLILLSSLVFSADFTVGFAQDTMGNDWRAAQVRQLQEEFKKHKNIKFIYTDGKGISALQVKNIEDLHRRGVDVLISSPMDAKLMTPVIANIYKSGRPVVLLSRTIETKDYTTFIHPDNRDIGKNAAQFIAQKLQQKGKVLILQHVPTSTPGIRRTEGFMEEIKKYKNIEVVGTKVANSLRAEAIIQTEMAIKEGLEFDAIYAQSDSMAIGAIMALEANGIDPKSKIITGIDYIAKARDLIIEGKLDASFVYPTGAKEGAEATLKILEGKSVGQEIVIPTQIITKENALKVKPIF